MRKIEMIALGKMGFPPRISGELGDGMKTPDEVLAMIRLKECGWGLRRIASHFACSRQTVKRYVKAGKPMGFCKPSRQGRLSGHEEFLRERLIRHRGNADVVRQELAAEKGVVASLRTVERAVLPHRAALHAEALACMRFETPPGRQLQIDFGERFVMIGGVATKAYVFVATLGYSRRLHVRAFRHERQEAWFFGLESAFATFGGVPEEVLMDNARALVVSHEATSRTVVFNEKLLAFARHWGFSPRACAPYRARTKGKTENGVGYVKKNAMAGRSFASWEEFEAHLSRWEREVANARVHGTTEETPMARFTREEAARLKPLAGRPGFGSLRELTRMVGHDCAIEVDANSYSVPWRLIGERVAVTVSAGFVRIRHGSAEVAAHLQAEGRRQRIVDRAHLAGVTASRPARRAQAPGAEEPPPSLLRPLADYEAVIGGGF
jgi:transposase